MLYVYRQWRVQEKEEKGQNVLLPCSLTNSVPKNTEFWHTAGLTTSLCVIMSTQKELCEDPQHKWMVNVLERQKCKSSWCGHYVLCAWTESSHCISQMCVTIISTWNCFKESVRWLRSSNTHKGTRWKINSWNLSSGLSSHTHTHTPTHKAHTRF